MSFPRYPRYKDSGVEWLGAVPEHWEVKPLGYLCSKIGSGKTPSGGAETYTSEGIVFLRSQNVYDEGLFLDDVVYITEKTDEDLRASRVQDGDILLNITGASLGRTCLVPNGLPQANVNQHVCIIRLNDVESREFVAQSMKSCSMRSQIDTAQSGAAREGLNFAQISKLLLPLPTPAEQTAIAEFLDRETGKIDALVAEQRRLMELLKEKRQAVISHAVTRGLNPDVPLKPSGIEWLGDVPEHWSVMPLKRDLDFLTSGSRGWAENYSDEGELFIRITNLTRDSISLDLSDIQRVAVPDGAEGSRTKVRAGDVLFSITAYLGSVAVVPPALETAYVSQHVALARLRHVRLEPKWVGFVALSVVGKTWFETQSYGGTKIQLSLDDVRDLPIPVPPLAEQQAIVAYIEEALSRFDTLTAEAQRAIDLLQERRTALISAAVTGQIDVRGATSSAVPLHDL